MILAKLQGGLSNQMFQYAAARRLAHRHGTELLLDASGYANVSAGTTRRSYELHHYRIRARLATARELIGTDGLPPARLRDLPLALWRRVRPRFRLVAQAGFAFDEKILALPDNVCLSGYWLSEKYFADIAPLVREELTLRDPPAGENARLIAMMQTMPSVSLHVRRGDYVHDPRTNRVHGTCSSDYYARAIEHIARRVPGARLFVFSDDLEWVEANLPLPSPVEFVRHNQGPRAHEDLRLMSHCWHHIIANSTFSWWGA